MSENECILEYSLTPFVASTLARIEGRCVALPPPPDCHNVKFTFEGPLTQDRLSEAFDEAKRLMLDHFFGGQP